MTTHTNDQQLLDIELKNIETSFQSLSTAGRNAAMHGELEKVLVAAEALGHATQALIENCKARLSKR